MKSSEKKLNSISRGNVTSKKLLALKVTFFSAGSVTILFSV